MEEVSRLSCIRGYHVYKEIWDATIGEELACERDPHNVEDRYAVAVKKDGVVTCHDIFQEFVHYLYDKEGAYSVLSLERKDIRSIFHKADLKYLAFFYSRPHQRR